MSSHLIVAIDGPSGVGKTTAARAAAEKLGVPYLSTGAMYRSLAYEVLAKGIDPADRESVEALAADLELDMRLGADGKIEVWLDGEPAGQRIRGLEIAQATSQVAVYKGVRERMVTLQRHWARRHGAVLEGRDIGTKVFPETPHKFFLDAPLDVRVQRRWKELEEQGKADSLAEVEREVHERDQRDRSRADSPLTSDDTYTHIDTGRLSPSEVVERIVDIVRDACP